MQGLLTAQQLQALGIDDGARPETLPLAAFVAMADAVVAGDSA